MRIVVLFNLKPGVDVAEYESWGGRTRCADGAVAALDRGVRCRRDDRPSDGRRQAPYQYVEIIDVADMDQFGRDIATEAMGKIAAEFQSFADAPLFITTRKVA